MTIKSIISSGIREAWFHNKLTILLYLIQLSMATVIGLQVHHVIETSIGNSSSVEEIIQGYNHTVLRDMINVHGASFSPLLGQLRWITLVYLIYAVFAHAGVISVLHHKERSWTGFWSGGARYFRPFLGIGSVFYALMIVWSAAIWLPFLISLFPLIESMDRERPIFWILMVLIAIWLLGLAILFLGSFFARVHYMTVKNKIWSSIKNGFRAIRPKWKVLLLVLLIFYLSITVLYSANFFLEWTVGITSEFLIIAFLVWQQFLVLAKVFLRVGLFASLLKIADT